MGSLLKVLVTFAMMVPLEKVYPLQAGIFRLKHPDAARACPARAPLYSGRAMCGTRCAIMPS
jgi:hypothetical protein